MRENPVLLIGKKLLILVLSVALLSLAVFCIARLAPGDPLVSYYGEGAEKMTVQEKEAARDKLGLNDPLYAQYGRWLQGALKGDFGISYKYKEAVTTVIAQRLGNTLLLGGLGFLFTFVGALALGILCAWHEDRWLDKLLCKVGTVLSSIPEFWLSLMLMLVFCVGLGWLPSSGAYAVGHKGDILSRLRHLILPLSVVILSHLWYYAYMVRNKLLEEARGDYVLLAKAKGLSKHRLLLGHCLRNVMPSYISLMAVSVSHILGGTYIVETVFSYPGIGLLSYESARYHDYNLLMVLCLMTGTLVILCNMLGRMLNERIDPRMGAGDGPVPEEVAEHG